MRRVVAPALVAAVVAAGSISAAAHSTTTSADCPVPTGAGVFDTHLSPSSGPAGTTVTVSGTLPVTGEGGTDIGQTVTEVFGYWNLAFGSGGTEWTSVSTSPQAAVAGSAVQQLGTQDTGNLCGYRFEVTIPSVPSGSYPIEVLYRWQPGYPDGTGWGEASFLPVSLQVTPS
jgi:hypothetical protein